jgi:triosephosphate isomerase
MAKIVVANWKMAGDRELAEQYKKIDNDNLIIAPPNIFITIFAKNKYRLAAQDCSHVTEQMGAFTGEISAYMLKQFGVEMVIIGHSERRTIMKDDKFMLENKLNNAINSNIIPILCIGENLQQYKQKSTKNCLFEQLSILKNKKISELYIAYEPVWAIGSGKVAEQKDVEQVRSWVDTIIKNLNIYIEKNYKFLYGGSVNSLNIKYIKNWDIDGVLVGGASLKIDQIEQILIDINR